MPEYIESEYLFDLLEKEAEESGIRRMMEIEEEHSSFFTFESDIGSTSRVVETIVSNNTR